MARRADRTLTGMRAGASGLAIVLAGLALVGCDGIKLKGGHDPVERFEQATTWPFIPVQIRIHPFTAIEVDREDGTVTLEARVEMLDRLGDVSKGVGDFRFELYRMDRDVYESPAEGRLLYQWSAEMTTIDQNRQHWDSITRTYLFRLQLERLPRVEGRLLLVVHFTDPGGRRLNAQAVVALNDDD